jgi:Cu2+-exporting ATPase
VLTAATGALARRGFIVTRGHAIEALAGATDFVFDKTGTLTHGVLRVERLEPLGSLDADGCLAVASGLERASEHPYGAAIRAHAAAERVEAASVSLPSNRIGAGIEAHFGGRRWRIGSTGFCAEIAGDLAPAPADGGATTVYLARDGEWLACIRLADTLKPDAERLVAWLRSKGRDAHLLSGDSTAVVRRIARELGIDRVRAEASADGKREYVSALQRSGRVVAMVGDGVNDAPVLAQANVSIAMASGAKLAQVQADAVLLTGALADLMRSIETARAAKRIVKQNLAWAVAYNVVAVPAAVAGWVTPWLAGIGMAASSLLVVLNATRLVRDTPAATRPDDAAAAGRTS